MYIIEPPIQPMLAKTATAIPSGAGWLYEPKWDGFRAIVFRAEDRIHIASRNERPLERYFPELVETLGKALPSQAVVDGEIVIASEHGLDFDALQMRIHPAASRIQMLSKRIPSSFVAFDLLGLDEDLRERPLLERRPRLDEVFTRGPHAFITPQTSEASVAAEWFDRFEGAGLDGIVAKKADEPYLPGKRAWIKIKHLRTADCVVGGYRMSKDGAAIGSLLLGLYDGDRLNFVGHTSSFSAEDKRRMLSELSKLKGTSGFGEQRGPGGPSRWTGAEEKEWVAIKPVLVCEVAYDHMQGPGGSTRFRHATTFRRWRSDKDPLDCTYEQCLPPTSMSLDEITSLTDP